MAEFNTRIKMKRDTSANWTQNDPVLLNGEIIIVDTADGSMRKKTGDGVKRYTQLPFDDENILSKINGKCDASEAINATLLASGWTNNQQVLNVVGVTATTNGIIGLAQSVSDNALGAASEAGLYICGQGDGTVTVACMEDAPSCDIPVVIILLG